MRRAFVLGCALSLVFAHVAGCGGGDDSNGNPPPDGAAPDGADATAPHDGGSDAPPHDAGADTTMSMDSGNDATSGDDGGADTGSDAAEDVITDAGGDTADAGADAATDASSDAAQDVAVEVGPDVVVDSPLDVEADVALDVAPDVAPDVAVDASDDGDGAVAPVVLSTSPGDGTSSVANVPVSVTFSEAMDPASLGTQTTAGACTGTLQVSLDNFMTCIAMASASPSMSNGNATATITPAPGMLVNWVFKIRVTTAATSAGGAPLPAQYTQATGFTTTSPPGPPTENETNSPLEANYCVIQFPQSLMVKAGQSTPSVYGRLYEAGVTPSGGMNPNLKSQVGFGPLNANPEYDPSWTWVDAAYNAQCSGCGNNDEYMASFTAPSTPGTYGYVFRMSLDQGQSYTYCDKDGDGSNSGLTPFTFDQIAILTVTP